jgi:hypothetical protein
MQKNTKLAKVGALLAVIIAAGTTAQGTTLTPADYIYDETVPRAVEGDAAPGWGTGSLQGPASGKSNFHLMFDNELVDLFGAGHNLTVGDLASISLWTKSTDHNWWFTIYTMPQGDGQDSASWYDSRLHAYPGAVTPDWTEWNTSTAGELLFNDTKRGLYSMSLSALAGGTTSHNYSAETIRMLTIQSDSGWDGFEGQIDGLTIKLNDGSVGKVNFEVPDTGMTLSLLGLSVAGLGALRRKFSR